jgi:hypothetical protein
MAAFGLDKIMGLFIADLIDRDDLRKSRKWLYPKCTIMYLL